MPNRYRLARLAAGMTQEHLAAAAEVSVSTIRRMETGKSTGAESRRAVASVLGISVRDPEVDRRRPAFGFGSSGVVLVRRSAFGAIAWGYGLFLLAAVVSLSGLFFRHDAGWQGWRSGRVRAPD